MSHRRKRRTFDTTNDNHNKEERSRLAYDYEKERARHSSSRQVHTDDSNQKETIAKRSQRTSPKGTFVNKPSSYTITKAREIPSAIHGLRKPKKEEEIKIQSSEKDVLDQFDSPVEPVGDMESSTAYKSLIIEQIKRDRQRRLRKEQKKREREQKIHTNFSSIGSVERVIKTSPLGFNPHKKKLDETEHQLIESSHKDFSERQSRKIGPKRTLPSIETLGDVQQSNYNKEDQEVSDEIIQAFQAIGVPMKVDNYESNGVIGTYTLSLNENFRVGKLSILKQYLMEYLTFEDIHLSSNQLSHGLIQLEVPLNHQANIPFRTLFSTSSLKLRKNDFKYVLGKTVNDRIFSLELLKSGHMLTFGGTTEAAKNVRDLVIMSLLMNHQPHELTFAFDTSTEYDCLPYTLNSEDVFKDVYNELIHRQNQFRRAHVRNLTSYNQRVSQAHKKDVIICFIDDLSVYLNGNSHLNTIYQILKRGKPFGIFLYINHSNIDKKIPFELLQLIHTRFSFKDVLNNVVKGADQLVLDNDLMCLIPTTNKSVRVTSGYIESSMKQNVIQHLSSKESR